MKQWTVLRVVRALSIVVVLAAIVAQAKVLADNGAFDATRFFAYFTIQSNLIGVAAFAWLVARDGEVRSQRVELLRAGAAVYLTITFFVVIFLLSGVDVGLQLTWVDVVLHKIFPIIVLADLIFDPARTRLAYRDVVTLLAYPLAWLIATLVRGAADGWYPYPFLDPANGGYGQVAITIAAVLVGFIAVATAIIWLANSRHDATRSGDPPRPA